MIEPDSSEEAASQVGLGSVVSEGFGTFYRANYHRVVALAVVLSADRAEAEDLAQDAFAAAHGRWPELGGYDNPGGWVRRVVANMAVSGYRRRQSETKGLRLVGLPRPSSLPYGTEHRAELWAAVRGLPKRQAQVVALFYLGDRSVAEVAELMGLSEGSVKSHLARARRALAGQLGMVEER